MTRRLALLALALAALLPTGRAAAQDLRPKAYRGYEVVHPPERFRQMSPEQVDGRKFQLLYVKYLKLGLENDLLLFNGTKEGKLIPHPLTGPDGRSLLVVDQGSGTTLENLGKNLDYGGNPLVRRESNIQVIGVGRKTSTGHVFVVQRVHLLESFADYFQRRYDALAQDDAQGRLDLIKLIRVYTTPYARDRAALEPLVEKLRAEAVALEKSSLPELPRGVEGWLAFARRHEDVEVARTVWEHPEVSDAQRAKAEEVLRDGLGARRYLGRWYRLEELKAKLGFALNHEGDWVPLNRLRLLEVAEEAKRYLSEGGTLNPVARGLMEQAMRDGQVVRGMAKDEVVAALRGYPVEVDRFREDVGQNTLVFDLWVMESGVRVYFCGSTSGEGVKSVVFKKVSPE